MAADLSEEGKNSLSQFYGFPQLAFSSVIKYLSSLHTQGKNVPQNHGVPGSLASLIPAAHPHLIYLLS